MSNTIFSQKPVIASNLTSKSVLLKNMFNPEEWVSPDSLLMECSIMCKCWHYLRETGIDWDKDLADDVKGECETKYGNVTHIKVEKDSEVSCGQTDWSSTHTNLTCRVKFTFSSMILTRRRKLSMASMDVGSEVVKSPPPLYLTLSCKHIGENTIVDVCRPTN